MIHTLSCWDNIITLCNVRWNKSTLPSAVIKTVLRPLLKPSLQSWVSEKFISSSKLYDIYPCQQMGIISLSIINAIWRASIAMELLCNCTIIKWSSNYSVISVMVICAIYDVCLAQTNNAVIPFRMNVNICMSILKYFPDFYDGLLPKQSLPLNIFSVNTKIKRPVYF